MRVLLAVALASACATTPRHEVIAWQPTLEQSQYVASLANSVNNYRVYQVTCDTDGERLVPTNLQAFSAFRVWNNSTTAVFVGGSDVNATTTGLPICTTTSCIDDDLSVDGKPGGMYCLTAAGTVVVTVIGGS